MPIKPIATGVTERMRALTEEARRQQPPRIRRPGAEDADGAPDPAHHPVTRTTGVTCAECGGLRFVVVNVPVADPRFGKALPCRICTNFLRQSGLTAAEQTHQLSDLRDVAPVHTVLRVLGGLILGRPRGWLLLYGAPHGAAGTVTGNAKSFFGTAMVAEFCQRGVRALYIHSGDLSRRFYAEQADTAGDGDASVLRQARVLVIDEVQDLHATPWLTGRLKALLEHRFRHAEPPIPTADPDLAASGPNGAGPAEDGLVTVLIGQTHPRRWRDGSGRCWVPDAWFSRFADARWWRPWPAHLAAPDYEGFHRDDAGRRWLPGILPVRAPDVRARGPAALVSAVGGPVA